MKKQSRKKIPATVNKWHPVTSTKGKVEVPIPVEEGVEPDAEAIADAASYLQTLEDNEQVTDKPGPLPPGVTHRIETDRKGRKRLVRKRFSAI